MRMLKKLLGDEPLVYAKGGGKAAPPPPPPQQIAPTPPVEEAAVKLEENPDAEVRKRSGKEKLKLPLSNVVSAGLKL